MQVTAQLNNLRIAPRKVRLLVRAIKGMDAIAAKHRLDYVVKKSSKPVSKLLESALSNAHNGFNLAKENLFIKDVIVNEGPKLKRFRPKGFGMASPIEKKTSHIKIVLEERIPGLKAKPVEKGSVAKEEVSTEDIQEIKESKAEKGVKTQTGGKPEVKKEIGKKGGVFGGMSGLGKKFFRRKAI